MEYDVRGEREGAIDVIRFSDYGIIEKKGVWYITDAKGIAGFQIDEDEIDDLILALKKLKEIY